MKGKKDNNISINNDIKPSKQYTLEELIELGKKNNSIDLAPSLFDDNKKEKE